MPRIITAVLADGNYKAVTGAWQWDYGSVLHIQGLKLDPAVEIHFSLDERGGESEPRIGITKDGVTEVVIPDSMLGYETAQDYNIYAFVYIRDADSGRTEYKIRIGVKARPKPKAFEKPEETELFRKAIEAVNESSVSARASEKSAEGWAHGHKDYPERENDNAAYYAGQAKEIASGIPGKVEAGKKSIDAYVNAQVTGFDTHVAEKTESAEADIEAARIAANAAVVTQQESSVQEVKNKTSQYITEKQTEAEKAIETKAQEYATSVDADIQAVKDAGTTQVGNVNTAGDAQVQNVNTAGTTQIEAVNTAGSAQKKAVEDAGREALNNIGNGVDATLSMEGKAADAAATGKAIDELKSEIDGIIIPEKLPNPQKLTFAGAVTTEYDGSGAVTVTIPEGSGGSGGTVRIEKLSTDTAVELEPNKLYIFPEMEELSITFADPTNVSIANEYHVVFQSGSTPTSLVIPNAIKLPSNFAVEANYVYRLSILEGCLTAHSWYNRCFTFHVKIDSSLDYPYLFSWEAYKDDNNLIWGDNWPGEPMVENENGWFTRELPPRLHNGNLHCIITCEAGNKQTLNINIDGSKSDVWITVNASYEYMVYYEEPTI